MHRETPLIRLIETAERALRLEYDPTSWWERHALESARQPEQGEPSVNELFPESKANWFSGNGGFAVTARLRFASAESA